MNRMFTVILERDSALGEHSYGPENSTRAHERARSLAELHGGCAVDETGDIIRVLASEYYTKLAKRGAEKALTFAKRYGPETAYGKVRKR